MTQKWKKPTGLARPLETLFPRAGAGDATPFWDQILPSGIRRTTTSSAGQSWGTGEQGAVCVCVCVCVCARGSPSVCAAAWSRCGEPLTSGGSFPHLAHGMVTLRREGLLEGTGRGPGSFSPVSASARPLSPPGARQAELQAELQAGLQAGTDVKDCQAGLRTAAALGAPQEPLSKERGPFAQWVPLPVTPEDPPTPTDTQSQPATYGPNGPDPRLP